MSVAMINGIPLDVFKIYMPHRSESDGVAMSCVYTAREEQPQAGTARMFKFPMRRNIAWTHFKISWHSLSADRPRIGLIYRNLDGIDVELPIDYDYVLGVHSMLTWAIPYVTLDENCGFYLVAHIPASAGPRDTLQIEFVGFERLLPSDHPFGYVFTMNGNSQFAFLKDNESETFYMTRDNEERHNQYEIRTSAELIARRAVPQL